MRSDDELLRDFSETRDETAFAAIVERHGPAVYRCCLRITGNGPDAEEAAQAVFVVLARRAASLPSRSCLAGWLHGVAGGEDRPPRDPTAVGKPPPIHDRPRDDRRRRAAKARSGTSRATA